MQRDYKPRRTGKRWLSDAPAYILDCFDNRGQTADRYSVLMYWPELDGNVAALTMSGSPTHPQGVSMWSEYYGREIASYRYREGRFRVRWSDLPENIRQHVTARAEETKTMTTATSTTRTLQDSELMSIEQALRLSTRGLGAQSYTIEKVREALRIVQSIPHSDACDCDYCHERREKTPNPYLCSVPDCGFYRNDDSEFCPSHY